MKNLDCAAVRERRASATVLEIEKHDTHRLVGEKHQDSLVCQHHEQACWQMRQHTPESPGAVELIALRQPYYSRRQNHPRTPFDQRAKKRCTPRNFQRQIFSDPIELGGKYCRQREPKKAEQSDLKCERSPFNQSPSFLHQTALSVPRFNAGNNRRSTITPQHRVACYL